MSILLRSYATGLEVRDDGVGRTITGLAAPYGVPTEIREGNRTYVESLVRGVFADQVAAPGAVPLTARHPASDDTLPIGVTVALREEDDGLHGDWHVSDTQFGTEVLALVRDRAITGLSIGFVAGEDRWSADRRTVQRVRAQLDHVAVVRTPAYQTARILAVRGAQPSSAPLLRIARLRSR
jgi:Escherichia/Staphylococcus phage prohead protease